MGRRPGPRGWNGRGVGRAGMVDPAPEFRGTTVQVCGLYPFAAGTGSPIVGVPLGQNLISGATVGCDPISWFRRANLIANPSAFVLGLPGLGKSTVVRRMALGLAGYGVHPFILGDLKPDYLDLVTAMGGDVLPLGRGRGHLNVLDPGESTAAARRLTGKARDEVLADAHGRRLTIVSALLTIARAAPPTDREEAILDRALRVLDERHDRGVTSSGQVKVPVLGDLVAVIRSAPEDVRQVALDRGDIDRYRTITEGLEASLVALVEGGRFGRVFSEQTTTPMRRDRPVVFDVSAVGDGETDLQAAILLACWSTGFGTINVANALAEAGLEPRRHYFVVLDELWRALRAGRGIVDRVDALTRLNRQRGVGMAMVSHTMSDLLALPTEEDRMKARGFVERAGMVICGGLPAAEIPMLTSAVGMSRAERNLVTSWTTPPAWDSTLGDAGAPPGQGKFLIKVGGRPGIPVQVALTSVEGGLNDTNKKWRDVPATDVVDVDSTGNVSLQTGTPPDLTVDLTETGGPDEDDAASTASTAAEPVRSGP